jgi:WD40 repeat protein
LSSTDQQNRDGSFSENGRTVVALGRDNVVRLWNTADGGQVRTFPVGPDPSSAVVLSPDGRRVVTLTGNRARIWSDDGQLLGVLDGHTADINVVSYSPDGKLIVTASDDKSARVWDATTGKAVAIMAEHAGPVYTARFLSDGSHVVTGADDQKVIIWSAWTGATVATLYGHRNGVTHIVSSLDGRHILTAGLDSVARKYEILTRADLARLLR